MWKLERVGLVVVGASLAVIAVIIALLFQHQRDARFADVRAQGVSLVRVLSRIPYRDLASDGEQRGAMQVLRYSLAGQDFAYSSVVDAAGGIVTEHASDGVIVPAAVLPAEPAAWLAQRELVLAGDGRSVIEFHAPLLDDGVLQGFVRLGYFVPGIGLTLEQLPFLATLALAIFLLVPLFYFLLRREVRPVRTASEAIGRMLAVDGLRQVDVTASGELGEFMRRFNRFIDMAHERIRTLEDDQARLLTSSKLLTYRKQRIETVLETLPEAVMVLDEAGHISYANARVPALFQTTLDTILNQPAHEWCDNPEVLELLARFEQGTSARTFTDTMRFRPLKLTERSYATKTYPLFSPKDPSVSIGTLVVFRDETREALARQARVDFVAHLSHELKSPLNVLGMYSESLLDEAGRSEAFRIEAANVISAEVRRLSTLINGLLSITQIESGSLAPERTLVKLRDLLKDAFDEASHSDESGTLTFEIDVPREMNPIFADKDLLRIAVSNLLGNAVKYNRPHGKVRLSVNETDDAIQIHVEDTGIGISEGDQAKIFDKFYRSDDAEVRARSGHGLGLALAKQIVELHHGSLIVNSRPGKGTEFVINLWKDAASVRQVI